MSAKFKKKVRRVARGVYNHNLRIWELTKPPRLYFLRYARWKKQKPIYQDIEKKVRVFHRYVYTSKRDI